MKDIVQIICPTCNGLGRNPEDIQSLDECGMCCQCYGKGHIEIITKEEMKDES